MAATLLLLLIHLSSQEISLLLLIPYLKLLQKIVVAPQISFRLNTPLISILFFFLYYHSSKHVDIFSRRKYTNSQASLSVCKSVLCILMQVILSCRGSFPYDPESASGKNRCRSHSSANLKGYNRLRTCLSVYCSRSLFFVLQKEIVFVALAVPSYIMPQRTREIGWMCIC
jgi:hypothetical protein